MSIADLFHKIDKFRDNFLSMISVVLKCKFFLEIHWESWFIQQLASRNANAVNWVDDKKKRPATDTVDVVRKEFELAFESLINNIKQNYWNNKS